jgi:hypothetical protein
LRFEIILDGGQQLTLIISVSQILVLEAHNLVARKLDRYMKNHYYTSMSEAGSINIGCF